MHRPGPTEYAPFYAGYIAHVPEEDVLAALETQLADMLALLRAVPEAQGNVRHAPYTWSVKEVVGHLIDGERIFGYRALRFSRGDTTPLPGFDENEYARAAEFDRLPLRDLIDELEAVRRSNVWLFRNLPAEAWQRSGQANGTPVSVRALAYILVGHGRHHTAILRKRLGSP
jgi:hypothetical protein